MLKKRKKMKRRDTDAAQGPSISIPPPDADNNIADV